MGIDIWYRLKKELMNKSKREIIEFFMAENRKYKCELTRLRNDNYRKRVQVKHFRTRLKKIRNSMDYLLEHPWSEDSSPQTSKHPRDNTSRVSQLKFNKEPTSE